MDKFDQAVKFLDIGCVIIIENDLKPAKEAETILAYYLLLSKSNKKKLIEFFTEDNKTDLVVKLESFESQFLKLDIDESERNDSLTSGKLLNLFDESNLKMRSFAIEIIGLIKTLNLFNVFFKYGITETYGSGTEYDFFLEKILDPNYEIPILLYENILPTDLEKLKNDLIKVCGKKFTFFAIIDNKLGEGDNEGLKIASDFIPTIIEEAKKNEIIISYYSIIFTSTNISQPDNLDEYHSLVVKKSNGDAIDEMYKKLTISSFSELINYFKDKNIESINQTTKLIGTNPENLTYFIKNANKEGIISYEAIRIWFENAINYHLNNLIKKDYKENKFTSTVGLSRMFDKELLATEEEFSKDFLEELNKISINEIFDYSINEKHLPIGPGDIFEKNGEYYTLLGQECDISIREKELKRNSELAELVSCEFLTFALLKDRHGPRKAKKMKDSKIARFEDSVIFNNFKSSNNVKGYLSLNLKTKDVNHIDFRILDLCMFNANGYCTIKTKDKINPKLKNYFTDGLASYFEILQQELSYIAEVDIEKINIKPDSAGQIFSFKKNDGSIDYQFKRICRVKGDFNHFIHHRYWNYRGRIGLNELNLADIKDE